MSLHYEQADLVFTGNAQVLDAAGNKLTVFTVTKDKNLGLGTSVFGASANSVFALKIGTPPTTQIADQIGIYAKDSSVGSANATLALELEADPIAIGAFTASHKIPVWINGTEYHIQLDAV